MFKKYSPHIIALTLSQALMSMESIESVSQNFPSNELTIQSTVDRRNKKTDITLYNLDGRIVFWQKTLMQEGGCILQGTDRCNGLLTYITIRNNGSAELLDSKLFLINTPALEGVDYCALTSGIAKKSQIIQLSGKESWDDIKIQTINDPYKCGYGYSSAIITLQHQD